MGHNIDGLPNKPKHICSVVLPRDTILYVWKTFALTSAQSAAAAEPCAAAAAAGDTGDQDPFAGQETTEVGGGSSSSKAAPPSRSRQLQPGWDLSQVEASTNVEGSMTKRQRRSRRAHKLAAAHRIFTNDEVAQWAEGLREQ